MYTKQHTGKVKNTVLLEFENGYSIRLDAGVNMAMFLVMDEPQSDHAALLATAREYMAAVKHGSLAGYEEAEKKLAALLPEPDR